MEDRQSCNSYGRYPSSRQGFADVPTPDTELQACTHTPAKDKVPGRPAQCPREHFIEKNLLVLEKTHYPNQWAWVNYLVKDETLELNIWWMPGKEG